MIYIRTWPSVKDDDEEEEEEEDKDEDNVEN